MKNVALLLLVLLTSCAAIRDIAYEQANKLFEEKVVPTVEKKVTEEMQAKAPELLAKLDTNKDNKVSLQELRGIDLKDPTTLMLVVNFLLTLFGIKRSADANKGVDDLYDVTHTPVPVGK